MTPAASTRPASSRPKPQLSCHRCRAKKLKCDRGHPCNNCIKDPQRDCRYSSSAGHGVKNASTQNPRSDAGGNRVATLEKRLEHVLTALHTNSALRAENNTITSTQGSISDNIALQHDAVDLSEHYVSPSHWEGVLKDIADIKEEIRTVRSTWPEAPSSTVQSDKRTRPRLFFAIHNDVSIEELRYPIVTKKIAGALLGLVTNSAHAQWLLVLIHQPTFREECAIYWQDPMKADLVWLAVFYALLSIGSFIASRSTISVDDAPNPEQIASLCLNRAAQCLRDSDYTRPSAYTISAMLLYLACEHQLASDGHFRGSLILGLAVRLAMRMGYHREPSLYTDMTVFQAEMRRRVWAFLRQLDHLIAQKCGLPRFIDDRKTDTLLPHNILDENLHRDMCDLPPLCPDDLPTPIAVLNFKSRILAIHGRIMDEIHNTQSTTYEAVVLIDRELSSEVKQKPAWLAVSTSILSSPTVPDEMNSQIDVDLMEQSARMMLHHKYLIPAHTDLQYALSREACLGAASRSLELQRLLFEAYLMHGKDQASNWRFLSLIGHDFLFAAMLICLDMYQESKATNSSASISRPAQTAHEERLAQIHSLRTAQRIWSEFGKHHRSGREAAAILDVLVKRFVSLVESEDGNEDQGNTSDMQIVNTENLLYGRNSRPDMLGAASTETVNLQSQKRPNPSYDVALMDWQGAGDLQHHTAWISQIPNDDFVPIQNMLKASQVDLDWNLWHSGYYNSETDWQT